MPAKTRKLMNVIDSNTAALAAEMGITLKPAKLTVARDKFMLKVGAAQRALTVGETIAVGDAKKLVGKNAVAVVSGKTIVAIR